MINLFLLFRMRYRKALGKKVGHAVHKTVNKMKQVKEEGEVFFKFISFTEFERN